MKEFDVYIYDQHYITSKRLIVSTDVFEIIFENSAYNLLHTLIYEDVNVNHDLFSSLLLAKSAEDVRNWLKHIINILMPLSDAELKSVMDNVKIIKLADIISNSKQTYTVNKLSVILWIGSMFYFMHNILSTYPTINELSVGCLILLIVLKNYLLRSYKGT